MPSAGKPKMIPIAWIPGIKNMAAKIAMPIIMGVGDNFPSELSLVV
jgi:hypothetical protein